MYKESELLVTLRSGAPVLPGQVSPAVSPAQRLRLKESGGSLQVVGEVEGGGTRWRVSSLTSSSELFDVLVLASNDAPQPLSILLFTLDLGDSHSTP